MAVAANNGLLPSIRTLACATLFLVLRLSHVLDKPWPALGIGARRLILFLWSSVTSRMSPRLRARPGQPPRYHTGNHHPAARRCPSRFGDHPDLRAARVHFALSRVDPGALS